MLSSIYDYASAYAFYSISDLKYLISTKAASLCALSTSINTLLYQSVYPSLVNIATIVLGIPVSSALVEWLFSVAVKIRPERCRLADATFYKLMFIRSNNKYFKN